MQAKVIEKQKDVKKQKAAVARSKSLTAEERSRIATKAALKKAGYPSATYIGKLKLGNAEIPCAVLDNGKRVVWKREVVGLLTGNKKGGLERYFSPANLQPYVPEKFKDPSQASILFEKDGVKCNGYEAEDLVSICQMYLIARRENALLPSQIHLAMQSEIIILGLAGVGIAALIDEATGYQEVRDRDALNLLLEKYLQKEYAAWAKRFPDEFYKEIYRLKSWEYKEHKHPSIIGKYTNDIVYERLAPGLLEELQKRSPKDDAGRRRIRYHQWMTDDTGIPALSVHIHAVMGLMRASDSWEQFLSMLDRSFPKKGSQIPLLMV